MKSKSSIRIDDNPRACTDGSIVPGQIIVQNYLTEHYLDRATGILESHGLERIANFEKHYMDPDGDEDSIAITVHPDIVEKLKTALWEIREVSDGVEAVDLIRQNEIENKLAQEKERFEKNVKIFREIVEGLI